VAQYPAAFGHLLGVIDMQVHGATEIALVAGGDATSFDVFERVVASTYVPSLILAGSKTSARSGIALLRERKAVDGKTTAYVCHGYVCDSPAMTAEQLAEQLNKR
jgi:uncharacterized protein YyaL (SSP411 family)